MKNLKKFNDFESNKLGVNEMNNLRGGVWYTYDAGNDTLYSHSDATNATVDYERLS